MPAFTGKNLAEGDTAPAARPRLMLSGDPIAAFGPSETYVICFLSKIGSRSAGPRENLGRLEALAAEFKDRNVVVLGVLWDLEQQMTEEGAAFKQAFGEEVAAAHRGYETAINGARSSLRQRIGFDARNAMENAWFPPKSAPTRASTFVVRNGLVEWVGTLRGLDSAELKAVMDGSYARRRQEAEQEKINAPRRRELASEINGAVGRMDIEALARLIGELEKLARNDEHKLEIAEHRRILGKITAMKNLQAQIAQRNWDAAEAILTAARKEETTEYEDKEYLKAAVAIARGKGNAEAYHASLLSLAELIGASKFYGDSRLELANCAFLLTKPAELSNGIPPKPDLAVAIAQKAVRDDETDDYENPVGRAFAFHQLARATFMIGKRTEAIGFQRQAILRLEAVMAARKPEERPAFAELAEKMKLTLGCYQKGELPRSPNGFGE